MSYGHSAQADLKSYKILHIILFFELFFNYVWPTIDAMISVHVHIKKIPLFFSLQHQTKSSPFLIEILKAYLHFLIICHQITYWNNPKILIALSRVSSKQIPDSQPLSTTNIQSFQTLIPYTNPKSLFLAITNYKIIIFPILASMTSTCRQTLICPVSREVMRTQRANKLPRKQDKAVTYQKKN